MKKLFLILIVAFLSFSPVIPVSAECNPGADGYCLLAPIPIVSDASGKASIVSYIPGMYKLLIGLAGVLAVLKLIFAGIKYMSTDAFSGKESSKDDIQNALIGLLMAFSAWIILYTVNPKLVEFNLTIPGEAGGAALGNGLGDVENPTGDPNDPTIDQAHGNNPASGCSRCVKLPSTINQKLPADQKSPDGAGCAGAGPCVVDPFLSIKLKNLDAQLKTDGLTWQVTEMFPPVANHEDSCHKPGPEAGKCVDVALRSDATNPANVVRFFVDINHNVGPSFQWEVKDETRRVFFGNSLESYIRGNWKQLGIQADGIDAFVTEIRSKIKVVDHATAEHVHINL
ncbi:MAG: seg [Parcubacteria group bacterium]|nr:seg [Parcubacteria group bacterium]